MHSGDDRKEAHPFQGEHNMAPVEPLHDRVMGPDIELDVVDANLFGIHVLIVTKAGQVARNECLHDEQPVRSEVLGHILEAADLILLSRGLKQCVELAGRCAAVYSPIVAR
jgi:hypothetical protein